MPKKRSASRLVPTSLLSPVAPTTNVQATEDATVAVDRIVGLALMDVASGIEEEVMSALVDIETVDVGQYFIIRGEVGCSLNTDAAPGVTTARVTINGTEVLSRAGTEVANAVDQPVMFRFLIIALRTSFDQAFFAKGYLIRESNTTAFANNVVTDLGDSTLQDVPIVAFLLGSSDAVTTYLNVTGYIEVLPARFANVTTG